MFDEFRLIKIQANKIRKSTHYNLYFQSLFNQALDDKLRKLVIVYQFNFEAIAMHLTQIYPQLQYKISKNSIACRWWQLVMKEKVQNTITANNPGETNTEQLENSNQEHFSEKNLEKGCLNHEDDQQDETCLEQKYKIQKIAQAKALQQALQSAQNLKINENEGFISYRPNYSTVFSPSSQPILITIPQLETKEKKNEQEIKQTKNTINRFEQRIFDDYGVNYRRLEQEYNQYNQIVNALGVGYHIESATDSSVGSESQSQYQDQQVDFPGQQIYETRQTRQTTGEKNEEKRPSKQNLNNILEQKPILEYQTEGQFQNQSGQNFEEDQLQICEIKDFCQSQMFQ